MKQPGRGHEDDEPGADAARERFQAGGAPGMSQQQLAPPQGPMGAGQ